MIKFDLELLNQTSADTWTHTNCNATDWDSECGWELIHGGAEKFGRGSMISKQYSIDIPHFQAGIRYDFYMIDSWEANDQFVVKIDGSSIFIQADGYYEKHKGDTYFRNFCGLGFNDFFEVVYRTFNHEANTLRIEMYDTLDSEKCDEGWGISNFQLFTYICDSSCLTCSGALPTNCKTCYTNAALNENSECKCNANYYLVINSAPCTSKPCSQCNSCDSTCYTCSGPASTHCISCEPTKYLSSGKCLPCTNNCATCTAVDNCQSCVGNYVLNPESSSIAKCVDNCPSRKYKDTTTAVNTCKDCDVTCETCSDQGANNCLSCTSSKYFSAATSSCESCTSPCKTCISSSTKCSSCISPKILLGINCVDSCGSGTYVRNDNTCQPCHSTCKECDNARINGCNKCRDGEYLTAQKECSPCDFTCKTCVTNPDQCESCNSSKYLYENKCTDICPDGNYPQNSDNTCKNCNSNCKTCTGPNVNDCKSCNDGSYISSLNTCEKCDLNCKTCEAPIPKKCLSCDKPNYLSSTDNICVNPCPDSEYGRDLDRTCQKCDNSCQKCTGPTSKDCTNCKSDNYLYSTRCLPCDSSCKTCNGGSSLDCLSCVAPLFLSNNKCIKQCPDGKYGEASNNQCMPCNSNCVTCSSTSTKCDTCKSAEYKTTSNICIACDPNCKTCIDSTTKCLSCISPFFLEKNTCVSKCQDGTFGDSIDYTCKTCSTPCLTCDGSTTKDCTSCHKSQVLIQTGECKDCDTTCLTCSGTTSDACMDCQSTRYFLDQKCLDVCPEGTYPKENPKKICGKCDASCLSCIGEKITDCSKCKPGDYFKILDKNINTGECHKVCHPPLVSSPRSAKCEVVCPIDQYLDKFSNVCKDCNKNCKTCNGSSILECTSCIDEKLFYFSYSCLRECPNGYYADVSSKICKNCPIYCAICSDSATCKQCNDKAYMIVNTNECSKCDQNGFYIDAYQKTCNFCPNHCIKCSSFDVCYECDSLTALKVNKCEEIKYIKPELRNHNTSSSYLYFLAFNQTWPEFFNNISRNPSHYSKIYLNNKENYNISIEISLFSELLFDIYIPLSKGLPISTDLIVELKPENEIFYKLTEKNLSLPLSIIPSCSDIKSYRKISQLCQNLEIIVPILKRTDSPLKLKLEFSDDFPELFSNLNNISNVSITGMNSNQFKFSIEKTNVSNIFEINLKFSDYFSEMKVLNLTFILPLFLKYHPLKKLIPESSSILLKPFINKDDNFLQVIRILNFLFVPFSLFTGAMESASVSFNGFISIYLIKYLRYIDISYPEETMEIFSNEFENLISFDFVHFYFDEKDQHQVGKKFEYYNISVYVLNNGFNRLIEILCLFLIGIVLKPIYFLLEKKNLVKNHFTYNLQNIILIFYFNLFIIYFYFYYLDLMFFCMVNLNKTRIESNDDIVNMFISILIIVLNFIVLIWFSFYLLKIHQIFKDIRYHIKNKIAFESDSLIPSNRIIPTSSREQSIFIKDLAENEENQIKMDNKVIKHAKLKKRSWWKDNQFQTMLNNRMNIYNIIKEKKSKKKSTSNNFVINDGQNFLGKKDYDWRIKYYPFLQYFILWKDLRKRKKITILYPIWSLARCFLYSILIVMFQEHFYILISSILSINLISLIFLIFIQPFKKWIVWGEHLFIELMVFAASLCSYLIASKEFHNLVNNNKKTEGWLIVIANYMDYFFCLLIYLLNILFWIFRIIFESYIKCFTKEKTNNLSLPNDDKENEEEKQKKYESENIKKEKDENFKENDSKLEKEIKEDESNVEGK